MKTKPLYFNCAIFVILLQIILIPAAGAANKIMPVDMQNGAGINYERWDMGGDMWDDIHPFETGYAKITELWYTRLIEILLQADAGPD